MNKNFLISLIIFASFATSTYATNVDDLILPKPPAYRLGTSSNIEKEYSVVDLTKQTSTKNSRYDKDYMKSVTYSDLTLKELSDELSKNLTLDKPEMLEDVQVLWAGAASKSETIKFALYKLSNPEADKPNQSIVKKIVRPLASFSSIAGAGFVNPVAATTAMMGGSLANSLSFGDKDLNYKFTKINDADMIVLVKKVDELQKKMLNEYFDYMTSAKMLKMSIDTMNKRKKLFEAAKSGSAEGLLIADAYYRVSIDNKAKCELEFLSQRAALEQLVGANALKEFESKLIEREKNNR